MPAIAGLLALFVMLIVATDARAQENLDRDKSCPKLFAASCVQCHKSARGLAKGRVSFMLSYYLRQHYTSSSASAQTLTAYLQSVDTPPAKAKRGAGKSQVSKAQESKSPVSKAQPKNVETTTADRHDQRGSARRPPATGCRPLRSRTMSERPALDANQAFSRRRYSDGE